MSLRHNLLFSCLQKGTRTKDKRQEINSSRSNIQIWFYDSFGTLTHRNPFNSSYFSNNSNDNLVNQTNWHNSRSQSRINQSQKTKLYSTMKGAAKEELGISLSSLAKSDLIIYLKEDSKIRDLVCNVKGVNLGGDERREKTRTILETSRTLQTYAQTLFGDIFDPLTVDDCLIKLEIVSQLVNNMQKTYAQPSNLDEVRSFVEYTGDVKRLFDEFETLVLRGFLAKDKSLIQSRTDISVLTDKLNEAVNDIHTNVLGNKTITLDEIPLELKKLLGLIKDDLNDIDKKDSKVKETLPTHLNEFTQLANFVEPRISESNRSSFKEKMKNVETSLETFSTSKCIPPEGFDKDKFVRNLTDISEQCSSGIEDTLNDRRRKEAEERSKLADDEAKRLQDKKKQMTKEADDEAKRLQDKKKQLAKEADDEAKRLQDIKKQLAKLADDEAKRLQDKSKQMTKEADDEVKRLQDKKKQLAKLADDEAKRLQETKKQLAKLAEDEKSTREENENVANDKIKRLQEKNKALANREKELENQKKMYERKLNQLQKQLQEKSVPKTIAPAIPPKLADENKKLQNELNQLKMKAKENEKLSKELEKLKIKSKSQAQAQPRLEERNKKLSYELKRLQAEKDFYLKKAAEDMKMKKMLLSTTNKAISKPKARESFKLKSFKKDQSNKSPDYISMLVSSINSCIPKLATARDRQSAIKEFQLDKELRHLSQLMRSPPDSFKKPEKHDVATIEVDSFLEKMEKFDLMIHGNNFDLDIDKLIKILVDYIRNGLNYNYKKTLEECKRKGRVIKHWMFISSATEFLQPFIERKSDRRVKHIEIFCDCQISLVEEETESKYKYVPYGYNIIMIRYGESGNHFGSIMMLSKLFVQKLKIPLMRDYKSKVRMPNGDELIFTNVKWLLLTMRRPVPSLPVCPKFQRWLQRIREIELQNDQGRSNLSWPLKKALFSSNSNRNIDDPIRPQTTLGFFFHKSSILDYLL